VLGVALGGCYTGQSGPREQTKQAKSAAMHDLSVGFRDVVAGFGEASVAKLYIKGRESVDELADDELLQLLAHCQCLFRFWEEAYCLYLSGNLGGNEPTISIHDVH
jgi:hypothetical protein